MAKSQLYFTKAFRLVLTTSDYVFACLRKGPKQKPSSGNYRQVSKCKIILPLRRPTRTLLRDRG
jgi:hypothetical protein